MGQYLFGLAIMGILLLALFYYLLRRTRKNDLELGQYLIVSTTLDSEQGARELGQSLVESSLAACVQVVGPISSTYRWKGQVEIAQEWLCLVKTREDAYQKLEAAIGEKHPYDVPEIVGVPVSRGSESYLSWLDGVVL